MKKTLISFVILLFAALSSAQNDIENILNNTIRVGAASASAKAEKDKLAKASRTYNDGQPDFHFKGASFEPRMSEDQFGLSDFSRDEQMAIKTALCQQLTARGSLIAANRFGIDQESSDRDSYEANRHVKKPGYLGQPTIEIGDNIIEFSLFTAEKREDVDLWFGRWWRNVDFSFGRETIYVGIVAKIIDRATMTSQHIYKVLVSASTADNVGGNLVGGFFGTNVGGQYSSDSWEANRTRALETAIREFGKVIASKDSS